MTAPTLTRRPTACKHCPNTSYSSGDSARVLGWRFFTGTNQAGEPMDDVVCPRCAGTVPTETPEQEPSWPVRCKTCDWESIEDDDEALDGPNAVEVARDHRCEPWVEIQPPGHDTWNTLGAFNKDGSWRYPDKGTTVNDFGLAVTP